MSNFKFQFRQIE